MTKSVEYCQVNTCPPGECGAGSLGCGRRGGCRSHWEAQRESRPILHQIDARLAEADPWGDVVGHLYSLQQAELQLAMVPTRDHLNLYAHQLEAVEREHGSVSAFLAGSPLDLTVLMPVAHGQSLLRFVDDTALSEATFSQEDHTRDKIIPVCMGCGVLGAFGADDDEADAAGMAMIVHVWEHQDCIGRVQLMGVPA